MYCIRPLYKELCNCIQKTEVWSSRVPSIGRIYKLKNTVWEENKQRRERQTGRSTELWDGEMYRLATQPKTLQTYYTGHQTFQTRGSTTARYFLPTRPSHPATLTPALLSSHLRLRLPNSLLPSQSPNKKYVHIFLSSHACHILRPSIVLNDQLYSVWRAVSVTKLRTKQFSAASCHSPP